MKQSLYLQYLQQNGGEELASAGKAVLDAVAIDGLTLSWGKTQDARATIALSDKPKTTLFWLDKSGGLRWSFEDIRKHTAFADQELFETLRQKISALPGADYPDEDTITSKNFYRIKHLNEPDSVAQLRSLLVWLVQTHRQKTGAKPKRAGK